MPYTTTQSAEAPSHVVERQDDLCPVFRGALGAADEHDFRHYSDDVQIPGLGTVVEDADLGGYRSGPIVVPVLGGAPCHFVVDGYDDDSAPEDFHAAIANFLALDRTALEAAAPSIYAYYRDVMDDIRAYGHIDWYIEIAGPQDLLGHVRLGEEPVVVRNRDGDQRVYVSVECECSWEPEHGLQIVFRDGARVTKVGPYDGHLANWPAHADDSPDGIVYRPFP